MSVPKFDPKELESRGVYEFYGTSFGYPPPKVERLNTPITPRENFRRYFAGEDFCWIPNYATDCNQLFSDTTPDSMAQEFAGGTDAFGCQWVPVKDAILPAFVKPGNPVLKDVEDWESFPWPDPDQWDWKKMRRTYEPYMYPERWNMGYVSGVYFERLIHLLDSENALCAILEEPECVHGIFQKLTEYHLSVLEHWKKDMDVDIVWIGDDWGTQRGPFISRSTLQEMIEPYYVQLLKKCDELGIYPITHSCGKTACYMDEYIKMGVKTWEPQTDCNPDLFEIQKKYKDQIKIGTYTLIGDPEGTMTLEEFRAHVVETAKKYMMDKNVYLQTVAWDDLWAEKNKIVYEISRKIASGEDF